MEVADAITQVPSQPRYEHSSWGFSVRELSTGEVLLDQSSDDVSAKATGSNPSQLLPTEDSYSEGERVAEHVSAPLEEFTKVILKVSHNPSADLMTCLSAVKAGSRDCEDGLKQEVKTSPVLVFLPRAR